ncbi:MAG: M24 family metallopeptidase [Bacillota bacterium]
MEVVREIEGDQRLEIQHDEGVGAVSSQRIKQLINVMNEDNLDGFILFNEEYDNRPSVQYLSGFTGSYCVLLITQHDCFIITDSRYYVQAEEESDFTLIKKVERDPWPLLQEILVENNISRLGYEADKLSVDEFHRLQDFVLDLAGFKQLFRQFRQVKDTSELDQIRTACTIAAEAFEAFYPRIKPGLKESELAAELVHQMRLRGAEQPVKGHFVVASGQRGQRPHGVFTDKIVESGDLVTFDFGAVYNGYVSDITRTVGVGQVDEELVKVYEIVLAAQKHGLAEAGPDHTGASLDAAVREFIAERGYGEYFTHSTGHGIGLELHEEPMLNYTNPNKLPQNSVVTIEPGIYIPGLGGVRIEDDIVITEIGCEVLTHAEKELILL